MFRAVPCSSSGGQIVFLQPLVSSLKWPYSVPVESGLQSALNRHTVTIPEAVIIEFVLLKMSKVLLETY